MFVIGRRKHVPVIVVMQESHAKKDVLGDVITLVSAMVFADNPLEVNVFVTVGGKVKVVPSSIVLALRGTVSWKSGLAATAVAFVAFNSMVERVLVVLGRDSRPMFVTVY